MFNPGLNIYWTSIEQIVDKNRRYPLPTPTPSLPFSQTVKKLLNSNLRYAIFREKTWKKLTNLLSLQLKKQGSVWQTEQRTRTMDSKDSGFHENPPAYMRAYMYAITFWKKYCPTVHCPADRLTYVAVRLTYGLVRSAYGRTFSEASKFFLNFLCWFPNIL